MTALTAPAPVVRDAGAGWHGFGTLLRTEAVVWLRDPGSWFFGSLFPTVILVGVGMAIPGMRDPITDAPPDSPYYGITAVASFLPTVLAMAIGTLAVLALPVTFAGFREKGVLRRLSTTPMRPQAMVVAHLVINVVTTLVGVALALVVGTVVFDIVAPEQLGVTLLAFVLGLLTMFSLGMLLAAVLPRTSVANATGSLVYFPLLFLAGLWTPGPIMPDLLREIGQFSPMGAVAQAMTTGWFGDGFPLLQTVVMVVYTAVLLPLAIKVFRWT